MPDRRTGFGLIAAVAAVAISAASSPLAGRERPDGPPDQPSSPTPVETLFRDVRVLDVVNGRLGPATSVLVRGNRIAAIGPSTTAPAAATIIDGQGRTLMPGLIDAHVHLTFGSMLLAELNDPGNAAERFAAAATKSAGEMVLRGFTSVRDAGGPIFPLKRAIDAGKTPGPRIWPSGAIISQTSGHGDFRAPDEPSRRFTGKPSRAEEFGAAFIADGRDEVLTATRENLRQGASQIKLTAGGGTSSAYDPIDVTQYTPDEMKAAVEAADDWNTYVTVHAYTPKAVRRAIEAGITCIEHGQLLDEPTIQLMAKAGTWLSSQVLIPDSPNMTDERREKRKPIVEGNARVWSLAKKHGVKLAWGTDLLFEPELNAEQNRLILQLEEWFTPAEMLRLVTYGNAQLLALSGPRAPYQGTLGIVEVDALADLLLVDGDPLTDIRLIADPVRNFVVIMKDGVVHKGPGQAR